MRQPGEILAAIPLADILEVSEEEAAFLRGRSPRRRPRLSSMDGLVARPSEAGSVAVTARYAVVDGYEVVPGSLGAGRRAAMLAVLGTDAVGPAALTVGSY
jgi:sugar/nucleoside kinase (ribokinase family)